MNEHNSESERTDATAIELADVEQRLVDLAGLFAAGDLSGSEWVRARTGLRSRQDGLREALSRQRGDDALEAPKGERGIRAAWPTVFTETGESTAVSEPELSEPRLKASEGAPKRERPRAGLIEDGVQRLSVIGVWGLMLLVYIAIEPHKMLQVATFRSIFSSQEPLVFLGLAVLCTFTVGEFDLSIASIMGLSATLIPVLSVNHGLAIGLACILALAIGIAAGVVNGFVTVVVGVDGFIVTLGSGTLLLGVASWASNSTTVSGLSRGFGNIALKDLWGLPLSFYYGLAASLIFAYILSFTPLGRRMTFVGANREVALLAGVRVNRIRFLSYVMSALIATIAGILLTAGLGGFDYSSSSTYLLPALSATFIGTAVIQPGRFNPIGSLVGVYFLASGILGLQLLGVGGFIEDVFYGGALILAVAISSLVRRRRVHS